MSEKPIVTKISPAAYWRIRDTIAEEEAKGVDADTAARRAMLAVGLEPCPRELVVDYSLNGPIWPFMDSTEAKPSTE